MDPNAALARIREALARTTGAIGQYDRRSGNGDTADVVCSEASELVDAVEALDGWLTKGGFLPEKWDWLSRLKVEDATLQAKADDARADFERGD